MTTRAGPKVSIDEMRQFSQARRDRVPPDPATNSHRKLFVELAAHYRLLTI